MCAVEKKGRKEKKKEDVVNGDHEPTLPVLNVHQCLSILPLSYAYPMSTLILSWRVSSDVFPKGTNLRSLALSQSRTGGSSQPRTADLQTGKPAT